MSEKPSYLGLLNAISLGESEAECYLNAWAEATQDDGVRKVIATVALREGEHGKAFAKRVCELGYSVLSRDNSQAGAKLAIAGSHDLTDREKFEKLGLASIEDSSTDDVFTRMFADRNIDIQTGALLGRYIAEERDSGRMLRACYSQLCAQENGNGHASGSVDGRVADSLARIECLLEQLVARQG
jgi:rubrerythrin